jgi:hypothetical protein
MTLYRTKPPGRSAVGLLDQHRALHLADTFGIKLHINSTGAVLAKEPPAGGEREGEGC